jgi:uncharacterized protein
MSQVQPDWVVNGARLLLWIFRALVDQPDQTYVDAIATETGTKFRVTVAEADMKMAIGKDGQTAKAVRTLLSGVSMALRVRGINAHFSLEIVALQESLLHTISKPEWESSKLRSEEVERADFNRSDFHHPSQHLEKQNGNHDRSPK